MKATPAWFSTAALAFFLTLSIHAAPPAAADSLKTLQGDIIPGKVVSVHGPIVVIASKKGQVISPLEQLDDDSLGKVADFLAAQPLTPPRWEGSNSIVAKSLNKRLMILSGEKLVPFILGDRPEPEFYVAYCSAHWCPPCRRFTPKLVTAYSELQAKYPGIFELVFISSDESSDDQTKYARETKMPWPVVKYPAADTIEPLEQWHGRGIPDLIVTNRNGNVIFKCYKGEDYSGPDDVLERLTKLLADLDPKNATTRQAWYRLEIIRQVRHSSNTTVGAQPYSISLNPRRYQTLTTREFTAKLKIDAKGKVAEVISTTPELDYILKPQFQTNTEEWLFLPAASNGHAIASIVDLPIKIQEKGE